jgi:hypothetical protein
VNAFKRRWTNVRNYETETDCRLAYDDNDDDDVNNNQIQFFIIYVQSQQLQGQLQTQYSVIQVIQKCFLKKIGMLFSQDQQPYIVKNPEVSGTCDALASKIRTSNILVLLIAEN